MAGSNRRFRKVSCGEKRGSCYMGWEFCALLRYDGPTPAVAEAISRFESGEVCTAIQTVIAYAQSQDYSLVSECRCAIAWLDSSEYGILSARPELPNLHAILALPAGFDLMFGPDAVRVYSILGWLEFLIETGWRQPVLDAIEMFRDSFHAKECIIARDQHPAMLAFLNGASFDEGLRVAADREEGEVQNLDQLYIDAGVDDQSGVQIWDSRGYWRIPLDSSWKMIDSRRADQTQ